MTTDPTTTTPTGGRGKVGCSPRACSTCPYLRSTPAGVWASEEYSRLPVWDLDTPHQPATAFFCHSTPNSLCTGWVQLHYDTALGLRLGISAGLIDPEQARVAAASADPDLLYPSGQAAALAGLAGISDPDNKARALIERLDPDGDGLVTGPAQTHTPNGWTKRNTSPRAT